MQEDCYMKNQVKTFKLFVRSDEKSQQIANQIRKLNLNTSNPLIESEEADLVIAIGGDGTFIEAVTQEQFSRDPIYTGIHTGTLGFLQDFSKDDIFSLIQYIKFEKELKTRKVYIASINVILKNGSTLQFSALNDVFVAGENYSKISFAEYINGELLQNITGTGINIATSNGDTALSLNANGAVNFCNEFHLVSTLIIPMTYSIYERFLRNSITSSTVTLVLKPANNISIIIDGRKKDIESHLIEKVEVSAVDGSSYINKLDIMEYSKVSVVRKKILGY